MRRLTAAAAAAAVLLLVACSPDAADFEAEAEKYIETRDFSEDAGLLRYTEVECEEPESTAADTLFTCAATADDGSRWQFDVGDHGRVEPQGDHPADAARRGAAGLVGSRGLVADHDPAGTDHDIGGNHDVGCGRGDDCQADDDCRRAATTTRHDDMSFAHVP